MSSLCQMGLQPQLIQGMLRDLLTKQFQAQNHLAHTIKNYVWRRADNTGILIEVKSRRKSTLAGKRPAILIGRNAYTYFPLVVNNLVGMDKQGNTLSGVMWAGSSTLFCLDTDDLGVDILASECRAILVQNGLTIARALNLFKFQVLEVGAPAELEEEKENFVVPITVGWAFQELWRTEEEAPRLRKVHVSAL